MRKFISLTALLISSVFILSACGQKNDSTNTLRVYNWGEYIDPDVIDMFEEETGIKVIYKDFESNEEMYPIIESNSVSYDVVCPSDYMIEKMIGEDLLQELNKDNIPNLKNIDSSYLEKAQAFDPGNKYSVPYCWGTVGILYNTKLISEPIDSWGVLFDEKYKGDILMMDSTRDAYMIALTYLGYDQNTTDKDEIQEATDLLKEQYPLVQAYVVDQVRDKMINEEASIGVIYSGEAIYTKRENPDLAYVVPKEGSNVWIDGWVIPKTAKNKEAAEKWIDFMCREDIALKNFEYITYSTPNKAARDLIEDEDIKNSDVAFPSQDVLDRCDSYRYLGEEMDAYYLDKWLGIKDN